MMATTALKKITAEAKRIRKRHPGMKWVSAVKQAGAKYRKGGISGVGKKRRPAKKKAARKKRPAAARKTRVKVTASVGSVAYHRSQMKHQLDEQLAWMLLSRDQATKKSVKNKLNKKVIALRRKLKGLQA